MNRRIAMSELSPLMAEVLQNDGEVIFTITGNSMTPMLYHRRDKVCIVKPKDPHLRKYDIPLFIRGDGKYILHRIVAVKPDSYIICGDNQCIKEYHVLPSQVIGIVKGFWRNGKYISCNNFSYSIYCRIWVFVYPVRWIYIHLKRLSQKFLCKNSKGVKI